MTEFIEHMEQLRNYRGYTPSELVCEIQWAKDIIDPYQAKCIVDSIVKEVKRRRAIKDHYGDTDPEIIQTIKERIPVEDVIEWYTQVTYFQKRWKFQCTIHGQDKDPSGVIYPEERRWWCFGCFKGGDVFDAVQAFERIDLYHAINKLAKHIGLDTKPIIPIGRVPF